MNPLELKKFVEILEKEHKAISLELDKIATKNPVVKGDYKTLFPMREQADTQDSDDQAHNVEEFEKERGVEQNLEVRLKEIDETLEKIKKGTYGICNRCQSRIEEKRLVAIPVAQFCVSCARER